MIKLMAAVLCGSALQAMAADAVTVTVKPSDDLAKALAELCAKRPAGARVELVLEDGVYEFAKTFALTNDDVTVRAKNRGKAIVVGGWHFRGADMKKLTDARVLGRVPVASRDKVVAIDVPPEAWTNGFANLRKAGNKLNRMTPILTVDAEYQRPARWPNEPERFWITSSNAFFVGVHEKLNRQGKPEKNKDGSQVLYTNAVVRTYTGREMKWDLVNSEAYIHGFQGGCAYAMGASPLTPGPAGFEGVDIGCATWKSCATRFSFFNIIEEIDLPGEWSYDTLARKIVLYPTAAFKPDSVVAVGRLLTPFLHITGCRNRIEGLVFTAKRGDHAIVIEKGSDNLVAGCRFGGLHAGVRIGGRRNTLLSCDFDWIQTNGATLTDGTAKTLDRAENVVENCTFSNFSCLHSGFYSDAVLVRGCGNTLRHTVMHSSPEHAVDFNGVENTMEYCRIYDVSREYGDSGAVYVNGVGSYGSVMRYNDIGSAPGMSNGIYLDDFCCGVTLYGNILRNIGYFGIFLSGGRDLTIENNLITGCWGGIRIDNRGLWWPAWKDRQKFWSYWCKELGLTNNSPFAVAHPRFTKWMEKDGEQMLTGPLDNVYRNNLIVDIPGYSTSFFVCHNKDIPAERTVFEGNMVVRTRGLKPGAYDLATGDPNNAPSNIHTSASNTFRPIGPGIRLLDGTPENPIDLGFVNLPPATFDTADYMWEQQGWVNDDKLRALREGGLCAKPFVAGDLSLKEDARLLDEMPDFKPIPYGKIGLYRDAWRTDPTLPEKPVEEKPWWKFW